MFKNCKSSHMRRRRRRQQPQIQNMFGYKK
jgi:hypothetical protein